MKLRLFTLLVCFPLAFGLLSVRGTAQSACTYRFVISDAAGDGWDGSRIRLKLGANTIDTTMRDGMDSVVFRISAKNGDSILASFNVGYPLQYLSEIHYTLYDSNGDTVFFGTPTLNKTLIYKGAAGCSNCRTAKNLRVDSIAAVSTRVSWSQSPSNPKAYNVVYLPKDSTTGGKTVTVSDTSVILTGLTEHTGYDVLVYPVCADTGYAFGRVSFITRFKTDVGIVGITGPINRCGLGTDSVRVILKNFGGNPQSLITFKYSVNGTAAPVPQYTDGFYTGVLGRDSIRILSFKTLGDFSKPGEYQIAAWTEFLGDSVKTNDTFRISVTSPKTVSQYPYFEDFELGKGTWAVSDTVGNSSWKFGKPLGPYIYSTASGRNAWTTAIDTSYKQNEFGYLLSPCFDFSSLTADPFISLDLNINSPTGADGAWLESSTDAGKTWFKVGGKGTGLNWYNDSITLKSIGALWSGKNNTGWRPAATKLAGLAGKASCRLRFAFASTGTNTTIYGGVGVDNIVIYAAQPTIDFAAGGATHFSTLPCGSTSDSVQMTITNTGTTRQYRFSVGYSIDKGTAVIEKIDSLSIQPAASAVYRFKAPFNSTVMGNHFLRVWVSLPSDVLALNDTISEDFVIPVGAHAPTVYNFNDDRIPQGWTLGGVVYPGGLPHGATSPALYADIYNQNQVVSVTTSKWGPIQAGDSLSYDYRFVNDVFPYNGYKLFNNDRIEVSSVACGDTGYVLLDTLNRVNDTINIVMGNKTTNYATRKVSLSKLVGKTVQIRFKLISTIATTAGYFFDLDNVNYIGCSPFAIAPSIYNVTSSGANNGSILGVVPTTGTGPFTYKWTDPSGALIPNVTTSLTGLAPGAYTLNISDTKGCSDTKIYTVSIGTAITDPTSSISRVSLYPNPTSGLTTLAVEFNKTLDAQVHLFNLMGQALWQTRSAQTSKEEYELDLRAYPAGIYFVRITADNRVLVVKVMKQ